MHPQLKNRQHLHPREIFICALFLVMVVTSADYTEGPLHGLDSGIKSIIVCPEDGAMTGINYRSTESVGQIEFVCTSVEGETTFGPYGRVSGKQGSIHCPPQHYISSFYGSNTTKLNSLGIRCRHRSNMYNEGKFGGEFGEENGTIFDELALSIGARPVKVTVYESHVSSNKGVHAIQVDYKDISIRYECNEWGKAWHGADAPITKMNTTICPKDGVINMIEYTYGEYSSGSIIHSIKFRCISSLGETYHGPYGRTRGESKSLKCGENEHIHYFKGRAGEYVNELEINCTKSGQPVPKFTQNGLAVESLEIDRNGKVLKDGNFNDECFATRGRRPVKIEIYVDDQYVFAIGTYYQNMPVSVNCKLTHFEVTEKILPNIDGYEVIGFTSASSCSTSQQQINLDLVESESMAVEVELRTTEEKTNRLKGFNGYDKVFKATGVISDKGNTNSMSNSAIMSISKQQELSKGTTINYQGPGAAIVVGYKIRYKIEKEKAVVLNHYTCEGGSKKPEPGILNLTSTMFGHAFFLDYQFHFNTVNECSTYARECVANIKINQKFNLKSFHYNTCDTSSGSGRDSEHFKSMITDTVIPFAAVVVLVFLHVIIRVK